MLYVHGLGHAHPPTVIDNTWLEALDIGTTEAWILENVGIRTRRTVLPLDYLAETRNADPRAGRALVTHRHADLAANAARMALSRAGLDAGAIGWVINGCSSIEVGTPAEACTVAAALELDVPAFDLNAACTTFAAQLHHLCHLAVDTSPDYILLTVPETTTPCLDYTNRDAAVLFGDAAAAAVVSLKHPAPVRITRTIYGSQPADWRRVHMPTGGHMSQDARVVQKFVVKRTAQLYRTLTEDDDGPNAPWLVAQQASLSLLESVRCLLDLDASRHLFNADEFGNTAAGGAPTVLSQHWDRLASGDTVVLATAGAGLAWGGARFTVEGDRA